MKKYRPLIIGILLILGWKIWGNTFGLNNTRASCSLEKSIDFHGKIKSIYQDSVNPPLKKILLTDGRVIGYIYTHGLWMKSNTGDSVVKKANTLQYLIYRNCDTFQVDTFGSNIDCNGLKGDWL